MDTNNKQLQLELLWWGLTLVIALLVIAPIFLRLNNFPFYWLNFLYVITFITLTRYIFLLKHTFLAYREKLKIALVFLSIPMVFLLAQEVNLFQTFLDEQGIESIVGSDTSIERRTSLAKYIHNEIMLFGMGSVISGVLFPLRLILSIWRARNDAGV